MATILSFSHSQSGETLIPVPNFIQQASACRQIVDTLAESIDSARLRTLSHQLYACLIQLQPQLLDPIPECLVDTFTSNRFPADPPCYEPDCTDLCRYCVALSAVLSGHEVTGKSESALRDLLCELTDYFVAEMMAPRRVA